MGGSVLFVASDHRPRTRTWRGRLIRQRSLTRPLVLSIITAKDD